MRQWKVLAAAASIGAITALVVPVRAETLLFSDNFDTEHGGKSQNNYDHFAQWDVLRGSVDLCGVDDHDHYLPNNKGLYVDLDGSTNCAGKLATKETFKVIPGTYLLQFDLAGSQRNDTNTVNVSLGGAYTETFTLPSAAPQTTYRRSFIVYAPMVAKLIFEHSGGDNYGIFLDNVSLSYEGPNK